MAEQQAKIGAGHAAAMFRLGLRELRAVFYPESDIAQPSEYGVFGTRTPGEVAADRRHDATVQRLEQEPPIRSPSAIASDARGDRGHGAEPRHGHGGTPGRSPGQIAADAHHGGHVQQQHGHEHELHHGF